MPEMTKRPPEDGDPTRDAQDAAVRTVPGKAREAHEARCTQCGHPGSDHTHAAPGTRRWFWRKRFENLLLIFGPLIPATSAVGALWKPSVTTPLTDKQAAAINKAYEYTSGKPSTVNDVHVVFDHPSIMDRLVAAGPSLVFAVLLGFLAYALWRIEINMSGNVRPYTEKDRRIFGRAMRWLWTGWWVVLALELLGSFWYHYGPSDGWFHSNTHVPLDGLSVVILSLSGVMYVVARMYRTGHKAYEELEQAV